MVTTIKPLWKHQRDAVDKCSDGRNFMFLFEVGVGKTAAAICALREHFNKHGFQKTLILVPKGLAGQWVQAFAEWSKVPAERIIVVSGTWEQRREQLERIEQPERGCVVITNYEIWRTKAWEDFVEFGFTTLILDEAHKLKDPTSGVSKALLKLTGIGRKLALTATPTGGRLIEMFGLARHICPNVFGKNFFTFRAKYFFDKNSMWAGKQSYFPDFVPKKGSEEAIMTALAPYAAVARAEDCIDLPALVERTVKLDMPEELRAQYEALKKDFVLALSAETTITAEFAITKAMKLRQLACGFIIDSEKDDVKWLSEYRLEALAELVDQLPEDASAIIWVPFRALYEKIASKIGQKDCVFIVGGQSDADRNEAIRAFNAGEKRFLITNEQAGGAGLNLQIASHAIWFALDYRSIPHSQARGRNYRAGSINFHKTVFFHHFVATNTIDEIILAALEGKQDLLDALLKML